ncbi:MAG: nitrile hydratase accessory protein [Gammaproteobacteria bacterium]
MTLKPDLASAAALPQDQDGPVFAAPWEAQAFAIVVKLFEQGHYSWPEWVKYLSAEIAAAKNSPDPAQAPAYYEQWLAAAEKLLVAKGLTTRAELAERKRELATPAAAHDHDHDH